MRCRTSQHALPHVSGGWAAQHADEDVHEARSTGDHDILDIGVRLELGRAREDRGILPDAEVLEELLARDALWRTWRVNVSDRRLDWTMYFE